MSRITVVEDDIFLREELILTFKTKGYSATGISSFEDSLNQIILSNPDIVVLDVNLPNKSGYELCKYLKSKYSFPVLILTARDSLSDELKALGLGADDFITKPCHPDRLIARVTRLLEIYSREKNIIHYGNIILDTDTFKLSYNSKIKILCPTEGKILMLLIQKAPETVSQSEIIGNVWNTDEYIDDNILQVNITRLRKNLSGIGLKDIITTVRAHGYRLEEYKQ